MRTEHKIVSKELYQLLDDLSLPQEGVTQDDVFVVMYDYDSGGYKLSSILKYILDQLRGTNAEV